MYRFIGPKEYGCPRYFLLRFRDQALGCDSLDLSILAASGNPELLTRTHLSGNRNFPTLGVPMKVLIIRITFGVYIGVSLFGKLPNPGLSAVITD